MNTASHSHRLSGPMITVGVFNLVLGIGLAVLYIWSAIMATEIQGQTRDVLNDFRSSGSSSSAIVHGDPSFQATLRPLDQANGSIMSALMPFMIGVAVLGILLATASLGLMRRQSWSRPLSLGVVWILVGGVLIALAVGLMNANWALASSKAELVKQAAAVIPALAYLGLAASVLHSRACRMALAPREVTEPATTTVALT